MSDQRSQSSRIPMRTLRPVRRRSGGQFNGWGRVIVVAVPVLLGIGFALSARAELALLTNGEYLKVDDYALEGDRFRLDLQGGGTLFLPVGNVERIVDDEIVAEPPKPAPSQVSAEQAPSFNLRWSSDAEVPDVPYADLFVAAGKKHELNPTLLAAMARAESAYDPSALSHKGARGLLQLMPATAERFGVQRHELYNPARNVEAASKYLNFLIREFDGELEHVLAAYNAGEGNVRRHNGVPPFRETRDYIARIFRFLGLEQS